MKRRFGLAIVLCMVVTIAYLPAQNFRGLEGDEDVDIPGDYEDAVRDLVDRYEEMRVLLREQIERNAELYSEEEMEKMTEALRAQVAELQDELEAVTAAFKDALERAKAAEAEALAHKNRMIKDRSALQDEVDTLEVLVRSIEEERLFTVGAGFSRDGYIGSLGMFNLPGTNLSMYGGIDYQFRSQESFITMGVAFQLLPQRAVVEGWERLRRRLANRRDSAKAASGEESDGSVGDILGDALEEPDVIEDQVPDIP